MTLSWPIYILAGIGSLNILGGITSLALNVKKPKYNNAIANIDMIGPIVDNDYKQKRYSNTQVIKPKKVDQTLDLISKIKNRRGENRIKGIILTINSSGGYIQPSIDIAERIDKLEVPVVAYAPFMACSGAYWIASSCDKIVAKQFSIIGNIGVIHQHLNIKGLTDKIGVESEIIKSSEFKDIGNQFRGLEDKEREYIQKGSDHIRDNFVKWIAERRKNFNENSANGLPYSGEEALEHGLVDIVGKFDDAIKTVEELGGFKHDMVWNYNLDEQRKSLFSTFFSMGSAFGEGLSSSVENRLKIL